MALGADRGNVVRMVMRSAFLQAGLGLAIGVPVAIFGARTMADQLYGVRSYDPVSLLIAMAVLLGSAAVAGFIPARRAANIEPMTALRTE
jgi:ABC-type antimicrobial peptide transport system permease subunit